MESLLTGFFVVICFTCFGQKSSINNQIVAASCGQCQLQMKEKYGCDLAVRFNGKSYFVEGTRIDDHGDAHSKKGFCNAIRKVEVSGEIKKGKFVASSFRVLPVD